MAVGYESFVSLQNVKCTHWLNMLVTISSSLSAASILACDDTLGDPPRPKNDILLLKKPVLENAHDCRVLTDMGVKTSISNTYRLHKLHLVSCLSLLPSYEPDYTYTSSSRYSTKMLLSVRMPHREYDCSLFIHLYTKANTIFFINSV